MVQRGFCFRLPSGTDAEWPAPVERFNRLRAMVFSFPVLKMYPRTTASCSPRCSEELSFRAAATCTATGRRRHSRGLGRRRPDLADDRRRQARRTTAATEPGASGVAAKPTKTPDKTSRSRMSSTVSQEAVDITDRTCLAFKKTHELEAVSSDFGGLREQAKDSQLKKGRYDPAPSNPRDPGGRRQTRLVRCLPDFLSMKTDSLFPSRKGNQSW